MHVIRGTPQHPLPRSALTIGNFDGLHRGHIAMLDRLKAEAQSRQLVSVVMTFEPHPRELFTPDSAPARLTSLREKIELLREAQIDYLVVHRFSKAFAAIDALTFRDQIVAQQLNAGFVLVGDDFQFGAKRSGDFNLLAASNDFVSCSLPTLQHDAERVSSTAVRNALALGNMAQAAALLNRPYSIAGRVVGGDQLGRTFGFPTANIQLKHNKPPLFGIFVVEVEGLERTYQGVASLGFRPTIHGGDLQPKLEVHIFDFDRDIYRSHLRINFLAKLRDEEKYPDFDSLIAQIQKDCDQARAWFAAR
ncbi:MULTISPECIES: bifunctional riboflavin kinase/FAD synthetase [Deefgea]|uniref:Riboflavin biosynthesis protein n=1 Tax=Deefgea chitinilytica TaxID=570276 RepID=A0ABS2C9H6_9NEIS|nr:MULTISPECIES: bifunctional riboflavin kinase/FAD synthetase [Deefgea]MBM5570702.1 bifunctional riboflavin kinase/FAD synthetase [Deefgea chitinilytica]MBM9887931.1 bifunctional riboflavin kinase/FAD synthetase [Deefgea sp. CFH1-16]